ncbi:MAG: hypothetical protein WBM07_04585 [Chitinivibrionales bacterium]
MKKYISLIMVFFIVFSYGCNPVSYHELLNYIEISPCDSLKGQYDIRSETVPNSFLVYSDYRLVKKKNEYFLSIYLSTPKHNKKKIKYMEWGGIKIIIQDSSIDFKNSRFFYKDNDGKYEIVKSTQSSWKNRMIKKWEPLKHELIGSDSTFQKALKEI